MRSDELVLIGPGVLRRKAAPTVGTPRPLPKRKPAPLRTQVAREFARAGRK